MTFDAKGTLWISDMVGHRIYKYQPDSGLINVVTDYAQGGPLQPMGLAVVDERLFVVDQARKWVMTVDMKSGKAEGWLGGMTHRPRYDFADPCGLCFDGKRYLFVSDRVANCIVRIDIVEKKAELYAGGGETAPLQAEGSDPTKLTFDAPTGMAVAADGTLYVADRYRNRRGIRAIKPNGSTVFVAGAPLTKPGSVPIGDGGPAKTASLHFPRGVAVDAGGNVYVSDCNHRRIRRIERSTGLITSVLGNGDARGGIVDGDPKDVNLWSPRGLAFDRAGNLYVVDINFKGVLKLDLKANRVDWIVKDARLQSPRNVASGQRGEVYISDPGASVIWQVSSGGKLSIFAGVPKEAAGFQGDGKPAQETVLNRPIGIAVGSDGDVYISDTDNHRIRVVRKGVVQTVAGTGEAGMAGIDGSALTAQVKSPAALTVDENGNLFVVDSAYRICKIEKSSGVLRYVAGAGYGFGGDGGPAGEAQFNQIEGLAVWQGELYVADNANHALRRVTGV